MSVHRLLSIMRVAAVSGLALVLPSVLTGCGNAASLSGASGAEPTEVVLASTTSTQDSGLFDVLIPAFEKAHPKYVVKVIAVGTGEALALGRTKDADVLLVHATPDEEEFVAAGYGVERRDVMYNDFVLVGPAADPSGVKAAADLPLAMQALAEGAAAFVSRGDDSGTHRKELELWSAAGVTTPTPDAHPWYESAGQGMGEVLLIASNKGGYTLSDRATYLSMRDALDLVVVREGDDGLRNQYGVIVVSGARNQAGGQAFFDWILGEQGQRVIGEYGVEEYGQALFIPNAK